jgi:PmbA/TldA metallopeptidase C-terminal domain
MTKMKKSIQKTIRTVVLAVLALPSVGYSQDMPVILKAMYDEQQRSMKELRLEGHEAPFYISYDITDLKTYFFSATSGALLRSGSQAVRSKNMRILVGGYEFNDESLDNDIFTNPQPNEIAMPLEDDYAGIRRSLWVTTDAIYRSAAQHFRENQNILKEKGKDLKDLPHRTFAKVAPQQVNQYRQFAPVNEKQYEDYVRKLSEYFRGVPEIFSSNVSLNIVQGNRYYLNSEGTSAITPATTVFLQISAAKDHKPTSNKELERYYLSLDKLPSVEQLSGELKEFAARLLEKKSAIKLEEEYSGPVLFMDEGVSELMAALLFGRETLMATNNLDVDNKSRYENTTSLENRIGKVIVGESMTVKAKPKLKTFQGVELMGSFEIDDEGVTPPDELVLIEKGVLKTLLNDRSLTKPDQTANGHASGPGVIEITFDGSQTTVGLKQMLISKAKEEGFDFAYIIKKVSGGGTGNEIFRVAVATGKEERIVDAQLSGLQLRSLRKAKGVTDKLSAYNLPLGGNNLVSFICPEAILLEDIDLVPLKMKDREEEEVAFVDVPKE